MSRSSYTPISVDVKSVSKSDSSNLSSLTGPACKKCADKGCDRCDKSEKCSDKCSDKSCPSTVNILHERCEDSAVNIMRYESYRETPRNGIDDSFTSIITPLTDLVSTCTGSVEFLMRRKNKTVTLQWEPFSGKLTTNGVAYLKATQSFCNLPPYTVNFPIYIKYKNVGRITHIAIDPTSKNGYIFFYLNTDGSSTDTNVNDNIEIPGGAVTWIVDC